MLDMTNTTGICCLALSAVLPGQVSFPGSIGYNASVESYFSAQEAAVQPSCIVSVTAVEHVSAAVRILATANNSAPNAGCQFAIRAGGHASFTGAANIEGGVTLDLSGLDDVSFAPQPGPQLSAPVVSVGVGATWGSVYTYLEPFRLTVSGGRAAGVGVGGLLLGGGISYFGPQFGWACDAVISMEVVTANGSIVTASETHNADLLWALRGGANNFGIVTSVQLQAFEQGELWGGFVDRAYSTADDVITALAAFNNPTTYDPLATTITTFAYAGAENVSVAVNNLEYARPVTNASAFDLFTSLPALASTERITNLSDLVAETAQSDPNGLRQATATLTLNPTVDAINATVRAWEASLASIRTIPGIIWSMGFDPLPPQLYERHATANALGLSDRGGKPLTIAQLTMTWSSAADDGTVNEAARALIATIQRQLSAMDALDPFVYINYAAPWQDPFAGYGETSLAKLRRTRNKYDPTGVFTRLVPGGFKLS